MVLGDALDIGDSVLPLEFDLPSAFQAFDLHADAADRGAELYRTILETRLPLTESQRLWLVLTNQRLVERMISEGVVYAAMFFGRSDRDPTALTTAQFTVTVKRSPSNAGGVVEQLTAAISKNRDECEVETIQLPIGPGLAIMEDDQVELSRDAFGNATEARKQVRQLQVIAPISGQRKLACFGISTECLRDWDDYVDMMAEICKTIRWTKGAAGRNRISAVLDG